MQIEMIEADFKGLDKNCDRCPIANCMKRIFGRPVYVGYTQFTVEYDEYIRIYQLPESAQTLICDLINDNPLEPISFELSDDYREVKRPAKL